MSGSRDKEEKKLFSIGDVATSTGISVFALRMWERRYGHPHSVKLPSGHRRYTREEIERLKLIKSLVDSGERASHVLTLSTKKLEDMIFRGGTEHSIGFAIDKVFPKANDWDDHGIYHAFDDEWQALGPMGFVSERAAQLLKQVGKAWSKGELSVAKEHFISQVLEKFLFDKWSAANSPKSAPKLLLSSPEGEDHVLGLHLCAVAAVVAGVKVVFLGASMPDDEIVSSAINSESSFVCLSLSRYYDPSRAIKKIKYMRKMLPAHIELIVGGEGAPSGIKGVRVMNRCQSLYDWLTDGRVHDEWHA